VRRQHRPSETQVHADGERHIAQFTVYYTKAPKRAHSVYTVGQEDIRDYTNPEVSMTQGDMSRLCWSIFMSCRKCFRVHGKQYGIRAQVNNIYTVGDYFFIDFSLENRSNIKYDIAEIRLKLMDKRELKATNSQTIELTPVYMVNHADHFTRTRSAAVSATSTSTTVISLMPTPSRLIC